MAESFEEKLLRLKEETRGLEPPFGAVSRVGAALRARSHLPWWDSLATGFRTALLGCAALAAVSAYVGIRADDDLIDSVETSANLSTDVGAVMTVLRSSRRLRAVVVGILLFVLGGVTGAGLSRFYSARAMRGVFDASPELARGRRMLWVLDRRLDLTREQRDRVRVILDSHAPEFDEVLESVEPRVEPIRARAYAEVRAVLMPNQQLRFDEIVRRLSHRRHGRGEHGARQHDE